MSARDGGPAFPRIDGIESSDGGWRDVFVTGGMTLRDYFAGQALAGMLANEADALATFGGFAADAYNYADAMLAERERES